jgi:hypothetical protein
MPCHGFKLLVAGLCPFRPVLIPAIHVELVVDQSAVGHVFLRVLYFPLVSNLPPMSIADISSSINDDVQFF